VEFAGKTLRLVAAQVFKDGEQNTFNAETAEAAE